MAAALVWRLVLVLRTPVPSGDGCSYLWIARQIAEGRVALGLSEVFPPGFPLLCAPFLALGGDDWTVGACVCVVAAALTVWPLVRIADLLRPGAGVSAAILWVSSSLLARNAAEVFSEPTYLLAMAIGTLCGLRAQWWRLGIWSGIAFWIRPEGLVLAAAFVLVERRRALVALVPVVLAVAALAAFRWWHGQGFDPLPILAFHTNERDDLPERGAVFANLVQVPLRWFEAFGGAGVLPLLLFVPALRSGRPAGALVWQVAMQIGAICTFVTRRRFLLSAAVPVIALAGVAAAALAPRTRRIVLVLLVAFEGVTAWRGVTDADRVAERQVGEYFGQELRPGERIVTDLTRILWFAGQRPLWPRHFRVEELVALAAAPDSRFVALREKHESFPEIAKGIESGWVRAQLPERLDRSVRERGIAVFQRR
ncbi:MAG: hypothetical protein JNK78_20190 [Planctomycetes bacterium]|nr:hypothetical protein [Planctomycetota bacterium]